MQNAPALLQERGLELSGMMLKPQQNPAIQYLKRKQILEPGRELSTSTLSVWWGKELESARQDLELGKNKSAQVC